MPCVSILTCSCIHSNNRLCFQCIFLRPCPFINDAVMALQSLSIISLLSLKRCAFLRKNSGVVSCCIHQFGIFFLLDWLPLKARNRSLPCYLTNWLPLPNLASIGRIMLNQRHLDPNLRTFRTRKLK